MHQYRIFVEKHPSFDYYTKKTNQELQLISPDVSVKVLLIYDVFGVAKEVLNTVLPDIFADPVTDVLYWDDYINQKYLHQLAVCFLPGQYDQRADSAQQCLQLKGIENAIVQSGFLYLINGVDEQEFIEIKKYLINPIESMEKDLNLLSIPEKPMVQQVPIHQNFNELNAEELADFHAVQGFSMGLDDLAFIQDYFKSINRSPYETELKVLDTYWSDHCRHTTFETELTHVAFQTPLQSAIEKAWNQYLNIRKELNIQKPIRLMDIATIMGKYLTKTGKVTNVDASLEVNACSIVVKVDEDGKEEDWLLQFKNETHNHPTEVEPYGGASTCLGGAIRDPLSGRSYVFQAMRVSGAANPLQAVSDTISGKLPQRKITKEAAAGYSSYGNQIGLATTHVKEIYHSGYAAKRMEVGFVAGAVKKEYVRREVPEAGDLIVLLGGRTGRDGIGGATGSSKTHDGQKLEDLSAEVQKGNPTVERKIQRLFRNPEVLKMIKRCNDFGAGGVAVAVGEIADGVETVSYTHLCVNP